MHRFFQPHLFLIALATFGGSFAARPASAQFDVGLTFGTWTPFLPEYEAGYNQVLGVIQPDPLLDADQSAIGGRMKMHGFYHFAPTRTMLEVRASLAGASFNRETASGTDTGAANQLFVPLSAGTDISSADGETFVASGKSDVFYHDEYIGLRDRFDGRRFGLGEVTLGLGFSHMRFDQDFMTSFNSAHPAIFDEELVTNFIGMEMVGSMSRTFFGINTILDGSIGWFDVRADYQAEEIATGTRNLFDREKFNDDAFTFDLSIRTEWLIGGVLVRPTSALKYISTMPGISRTRPGDSVLRSDNALILSGGWEIVL